MMHAQAVIRAGRAMALCLQAGCPLRLRHNLDLGRSRKGALQRDGRDGWHGLLPDGQDMTAAVCQRAWMGRIALLVVAKCLTAEPMAQIGKVQQTGDGRHQRLEIPDRDKAPVLFVLDRVLALRVSPTVRVRFRGEDRMVCPTSGVSRSMPRAPASPREAVHTTRALCARCSASPPPNGGSVANSWLFRIFQLERTRQSYLVEARRRLRLC
jgi:hypothetical protein